MVQLTLAYLKTPKSKREVLKRFYDGRDFRADVLHTDNGMLFDRIVTIRSFETGEHKCERVILRYNGTGETCQYVTATVEPKREVLRDMPKEYSKLGINPYWSVTQERESKQHLFRNNIGSYS